MLPLDQVPLHLSGDVFVPDWLGPHDHPWLDALLDELRRFEGRPFRDWRERAREPLRAACPERRLRTATATLEGLCRFDVQPGSAALRERLFGEAQRARDAGTFDRERLLSTVGAGLSAEDVIERLFADVPVERKLRLPDPFPDPAALAQHANLAISQSLVRSASSLEIQLSSRSRPVLRQVLLSRLLATVRPCGEGVRLAVSGPFSLFRHTTLYGRALASLIPVLRGAERFTLHARCRLGERLVSVRLGSGDPIVPPGKPLRAYDSKLEQRFARDFARLAPDWDVVREPEPVDVDGTWIFPDFALVHRRDGRRWLLEIVGFWTPEYLANKLERLRKAGRRDVIVCVDEKLGCVAEDLPSDSTLIPFKGRVDAGSVLCALQRAAPGPRLKIGLGDLMLDFAGRSLAEHPVHARLAALKVGDALTLRLDGQRLVAVDGAGVAVAVLSAAARVPWCRRLTQIRAVRVVALHVRTSAQSHPDWRGLLRVDRWVVPALEVELVALS